MVEQAGAGNALELRHFDPYSVVLRLIARGDEPDYVAGNDRSSHPNGSGITSAGDSHTR